LSSRASESSVNVADAPFPFDQRIELEPLPKVVAPIDAVPATPEAMSGSQRNVPPLAANDVSPFA